MIFFFLTEFHTKNIHQSMTKSYFQLQRRIKSDINQKTRVLSRHVIKNEGHANPLLVGSYHAFFIASLQPHHFITGLLRGLQLDFGICDASFRILGSLETCKPNCRRSMKAPRLEPKPYISPWGKRKHYFQPNEWEAKSFD